MNRNFDIFRMSANGADPGRGTGREDQMRARTNQPSPSPFDHGAYQNHHPDHPDHHPDHYRAAPAPFGGFIDDHDRSERSPVDVERDRQQRAAHEMHAYPPTTYGNVPYDRSSGPLGPHATWRGRDEEHDFWGRDRHPDHGGHPGLWQRVKGAFTGKGPKNYVRSDDRIREDVCEHLSLHPYVDASDIEVAVSEGEVTLTGTVDARLAKRAAEECCDHVRGVHDVHNHLRVRRADAPAT